MSIKKNKKPIEEPKEKPTKPIREPGKTRQKPVKTPNPINTPSEIENPDQGTFDKIKAPGTTKKKTLFL